MSQTLDGFALLESGQEITRDDFPAMVEAEILRTTGPHVAFPGARETLTAFWDRLGPDRALEACSLAFGRHGGYWRGAPVTPLRFAESQDGFFAAPLLDGTS